VVGVHEHRELAVLPLPHRARAARCDIKNLSVLGVAALPTNQTITNGKQEMIIMNLERQE
jgi:hypothetical protein